jgi:hypothetical protein
MLKRYRSLLLSLSLVAMAITTFVSIDTAHAQNRRVYLEEFTGAWCGYCVRGAYAEQVLEEEFPGQVAIVSIHNDQGSTANDMMDNVQGDSMVTDIGFPSVEALSGFPDGWTARTTQGPNWNVDPGEWSDSVSMLFENTTYTPGIVDTMLGQLAVVQCNVDSVSFNQVTKMVTARVTATFPTAMTGDFRLNLMVTEDSVSGSGAGWDQHNYYSSTDLGPTYPNNPMYNYPESIPGWMHMHVFREAVGGIHGVTGVIPATTSVGGVYSKTFTFPLPTTVQNKYYVHLIGLVHQYSSTDAESNQVFDAMEVPLLNTPHASNNFTLTPSVNQYNLAHAGGDTTIALSLKNNGNIASGVKLTLGALPSGWSGVFSPSDSVTVNAKGSQAVTLTLTAPQQASFAEAVIQLAPQEAGVFIPVSYDTVFALSDNTRCPLFYDPNSAIPTPDAIFDAEGAAIPDSLKQFVAVIPLSDGVVQAYPPEQFPYMIFDNVMLLDNGGDEADLPNPSIVDNIMNALAAGARVFISSDYALGYAFDQSNTYFLQYAAFTETQDVQNFYNQIGLDFTATTVRFNSSTGADATFPIKGEMNDPIGNGIAATDKGGYFSCFYSLDSASIESFYCDGTTKADSLTHVIGSRYIDAATGGRLVYLGFGLSELSSSSEANTIATNSIKWLLSGATAGVNLAAASSTGITASPNPFHGISTIQYTASPDELNVTFSAYDLLGRQVAVLPTENQGGNVYSATFDASKLPDGTYVIEAHSAKGTHEIRVVNQQ